MLPTQVTQESPIPLSYIDVWLGGALDLQARYSLSGSSYLASSGGRYSSFVEETVRTTRGWKYIVNDRAYPYRPAVMVSV